MQILYSGSGTGDYHFCNPRQGNIVIGKWALDNDCFNGDFNKLIFDSFLSKNITKKENCLFIVMPDIVGNPIKTKQQWDIYAPDYEEWPRAFVAQDGQESMDYPKGFDCLFIGGTTEWKMSRKAIQCIDWAMEHRKHIHIGRINTYKRYCHFADLEGSEGFTYDGTLQRFIGNEKTIAFRESCKKSHRLQIRLPLFDSNNTI
jgi:hypothetical protein